MHASEPCAASQWRSIGKPSPHLLWLQDHELHEPLHQVLAGLCGASVCLGTAFQRPGVLAASAAWDPDAAAALCILAVASAANDPAADPDELPTCLRMRPALADCLRHVQADLESVS